MLLNVLQLPEVEVKDHKEDPCVFELHHKVPGFGQYPLTITAHNDSAKPTWLKEIRQYASDVSKYRNLQQ
jgi:hypothetical protein